MENDKTYNIDQSITIEQFCQDAELAAKAYLAYQRQVEEMHRCAENMTKAITPNEDALVKKARDKVKSKAYDLFCENENLPIIIGVLLYSIYALGVFIGVFAYSEGEIAVVAEFLPMLLYAVLCILKITDWHDVFGMAVFIVASIISLLIDLVALWLLFEVLDSVILKILIVVVVITARILTDIVPIARERLYDLYITIGNKRIDAGIDNLDGIEKAREADKLATEAAQKKAKARAEQLANHETPERATYNYYKDFCEMMRSYVKRTYGYNISAPNYEQIDYDLMTQIIAVCKKNYQKEIVLFYEHIIKALPQETPESFFRTGFYKYESDQAQLRHDCDEIERLVGELSWRDGLQKNSPRDD